MFETFDIEVLGLDKPEISVDTALSIRNAIVDGFAADRSIDLDVILIAPMRGNTGACIWTADGVDETAPICMVLNENLFGDMEHFRATMHDAVQAGRLNAPTGDPAYDAISHEMAHLRDQNARKGLYDKRPMDHARIGPIQEESSKDSKEARAFGFLYTHFAELKRFGSLPPETEFDDWLGQLDAYSSSRKKPRDEEEDRLFGAFESWLSRFESRADFDAWLRESGISRRDGAEVPGARRPADRGRAEADDEPGWVDLEAVYNAWLQQLDDTTNQRIRKGEERIQSRTALDPDATRLGLDAEKLELGALKVFNPAEALAEANNAFGRSAPADPTHPVYALQALLRGVPFAQVLKDATQRNALATANYRGPVPAASEFGPSIAAQGRAASLAARWRAKSPAARAAYAEQQVAYLNPDSGFVLDELARLQAQHRATVASSPDRTAQAPAQTPEPTAPQDNSSGAVAAGRADHRSVFPTAFWQQLGEPRARAAVPAPIHLDDPDDAQPGSTQPGPDLPTPRSAPASRRASFDSFRQQILAIYVAGPSSERNNAVARALADAAPEDLQRALREAGLDRNQQRVLRQFWPGQSDRTAEAVLPAPGEDMDPLLWAPIRKFASAVARVRAAGESPAGVAPESDRTESDDPIPDRGGLTPGSSRCCA